MTREELKPVAEALANQRLMRNGSPPFTNPLDLIQGHPRLLDEVYQDAEAAVDAWVKSQDAK